jgi:4-alpha-glucanotransferase
MVGFFDPKNEKSWKEHGKRILELIIKNTKMLPCAEDLGTVPRFCSRILAKLGIPGLELQRWKKDWQKFELFKLEEYRPISIATLSTHDLNIFPAWWDKEAGGVDKEFFRKKCQEKRIIFKAILEKLFVLKKSTQTRLFWRSDLTKKKLINILNQSEKETRDLIRIYQESFGEKEKFWRLISKKRRLPGKVEKWLIEKNLELINSTDSIFSILLIFEWLFLENILKGDPSQYRINVPGKVSKKNFSIRLPISLEGLMARPINGKIKKIIQRSGRS